MIPSKMISGVGPRFDIPAHTWSLYGCLTVGFNLGSQDDLFTKAQFRVLLHHDGALVSEYDITKKILIFQNCFISLPKRRVYVYATPLF